jgi:ribosomal-protein-alanine N-acetyltransferase
MNSDPRVMKYFPKLLSYHESELFVARINSQFEQNGFGLWAVEVVGVAAFAGFVGLAIPRFEAHFTPCVEVGWRLAAEHWNRGYTTEGAQAVLQFAFGSLQLKEIVAYTVPANIASRRVMEKIGMRHNGTEDFDHPVLAPGHPLRRHVLYRISRPDPNTSAA